MDKCMKDERSFVIGQATFRPIRGTEENLWDWWPEGSRSKVVVDENQLYLLGGKPDRCNIEESRALS